MKKLAAVALCALTGALQLAVAQITITVDDVSKKLTIGNTLDNHTDSLTTQANIGGKGSTSWDFSGLNNSSTQSLTSVSLASTPFVAQFPGATHALQTTLTVPGTSISGTGYLYLILGSNLLNPGSMGGANTGLGFATLQTADSPPDVTYGLPSTLGSTWTSAYTETQTIALNSVPVQTTTTTHNAKYVVDAFGPLKIPGGSIYDALRIKKVDSLATGKSVTYIFLSKSGASVQLSARDPASPDTGTIGVRSVAWSGPTVTAVQTPEGIPSAYALLQNFPNPFNPTTVVRYEVPVAGNVQLTVYDVLGREVATLVNETEPAGIHEVRFDAVGLASGVYLYRMQAGGFVQTRSMMLMR
jgi:hypothetical protein